MLFLFGHWKKCSKITEIERDEPAEKRLAELKDENGEGISPELYTPQIRRLKGQPMPLYVQFGPGEEDDPYGFLYPGCSEQDGAKSADIESRKLEWKVESKVGSLDNATHKPGGGAKKIVDDKVQVKAESKVGSLDNAQHKAGGGDKK